MKKVMAVLAGVFLLLVIGGSVLFGWQQYEQKKNEEAHLKKEEEYASLRTTPEKLIIPGGDSEVMAEIPVFFEELQEQNPDIYAWITIPGTNVDYPVLQSSEDNAFYLDHSAAREEDPAGAVFSEDYNSRGFEDPITILYGNNRQDGSMFGSLHEYEDNLFMEEHRDIYIYTPEAFYQYRVFASYLSDDRHLMLRFKSGSTEGSREAYIKSIMGNRTMDAQIDRTVEANADSRILTLSTHDEAGEEFRFLVQAIFIKKINGDFVATSNNV